jgi:hypothetical protein
LRASRAVSGLLAEESRAVSGLLLSIDLSTVGSCANATPAQTAAAAAIAIV